MTACSIINQNLFGENGQLTIGQLYRWFNSGKLACDPDFLQRLLNEDEWDELKTTSYISSLFEGGRFATPFLIVDLKKTIKLYEEKIAAGNISSEKLKREQEILDRLISFTKPDFANGRKVGAEYLLLDGQHRATKLKKFVENLFLFEPEKEISTRKDNETGYNLFTGYYNDLEEYQRDYFLNIPLNCVFFWAREWSELTKTFIHQSSGVQMTDHEKRIINYNPANIWVINFCNKFGKSKPYSQREEEKFSDFNKIFTWFKKSSKDYYDPIHKADTFLVCEFLIWAKDQNYEFTQKEMDAAFGEKPTDDWQFTSKHYEITAQLFNYFVYACHAYAENYSMKQFSIASLHNLLYTISFLINPQNKIVQKYSGEIYSKYKLDGPYKIEDLAAFAEWFFDEETRRLSEGFEVLPGVFNKDGTPKEDWHPNSFHDHNADTKHSTKQSFKGVGGSKYTFKEGDARYRYLLADLEKSVPKLITQGTLTKIHPRNSADREKIARQQGLVPSETLGKHLDHTKSLSEGGKLTSETGRFIPAKQNLSKGKKSVVNV